MGSGMTEFNCKERCGICCIICTDVGLTMREVIGGRYKMQFQHKKFRQEPIEEGRSDRVLRQKLRWIPEFGHDHTTCIYFDLIKKGCTVYDSRPSVCRTWNCRASWANGKRILEIYSDLLMDPEVKKEVRKKIKGILIKQLEAQISA